MTERPKFSAAWPPDDRRKHTFLGSSKCAECHQDIFDGYFGSHPMGHSVRYPGELNPKSLQALPVSFEAGGRTYKVSMVDGHLTQTESMSDGGGDIYTQSNAIDFAIGSGTRGYSFVSVHNGGLYQSPLTWYSQNQKWDLSPGYDPEDHPRFERRMSDGCVFCHTGQPSRLPTAVNQFRDPVFHEAVIGCERCHGPGSQHVSHHSTGEAVDSIVNPAHLDAARRDSVCYQCHLHGRDRILRRHRSDYDFRPGDRISDIWVTFVNTLPEPDSGTEFSAVSQVEQMISSRCYAESDGRLGCISCHDPHRKPAAAERIDFYRERCIRCHNSPDSCSVPIAARRETSPQDSCIQCHMPAAAATDVPHTAQTDHRVLREYLEIGGFAGTSTELFQQETQPVPNQSVQRALGLQMARGIQTRTEAAEAINWLMPFANIESDDQAVFAAVAWVMISLGQPEAAREYSERVMELSPDHESALESLAVIAESTDEFETAQAYLNRWLELAPMNSAGHLQHTSILIRQEQWDAAAEACRKALEINPLLHEARESLIRALTASGDSSAAAAQQRILDRIKEVQQRAAE